MPNFFNPYQYPQYGYPMQNQQVQNVQPQTQQQIQSGGFLPAPNEEYARNYPVALGNSVTFKDESAPYIYTKTMGFSQLDSPTFDKYRLVKEEPKSAQNEPLKEEADKTYYDELKAELEETKRDLEDAKREIRDLKRRVESLIDRSKPKFKKEEGNDTN